MDFDEALKLSETNPFIGLEASEALNLLKDLKKNLHPDTVGDHDKDKANEAFIRVAGFYDNQNPSPTTDIVLHTKEHIYKLGEVAASGSISVLYWAKMLDDGDREILVKMPRNASDNDLMTAEGNALTAVANGPETYKIFFPEVVELFSHRETNNNVQRKCLVLEPIKDVYTIEELVKSKPIDSRDIAWIFRRIYTAVGHLHSLGLSHNALTPNNILVDPAAHHVYIVGLGYSTKVGTSMKAFDGEWLSSYPPEVRIKKPHGGPETDIYMIGSAMLFTGSDMPGRMKAHAKALMASKPTDRPKDAWVLLGAFDKLLSEIFGPPSFHEMTVPATAKTSLN